MLYRDSSTFGRKLMTTPELFDLLDQVEHLVQRIKQAIQPTSGQLAPIEPIPFNPPYVPVEPSGFMVPTGTYRGRRLNELDNDTLRNLYNGFKGCGKRDVADQILAEIHLRRDL